MASHNDDGSPKVGYKNPPLSTRFKKGKSGNPQGRPKGALNMETLLLAELREKVVINESGQRKTVTKWEAALKQLVNKAASGDLRALRELLALAKESESRESSDESSDAIVFGEIDKRVMKGILARVQTK